MDVRAAVAFGPGEPLSVEEHMAVVIIALALIASHLGA